ncbi:hypothetical protein K0M31_005793 [Melipona bicolor]|uniref:Uncharacterized protein n=1 Tax=Melipona bicolor TaxID=60889 RepID=A0AA40FUM8_9HYME|nr:hypothetical protein K0M31_005793 [Melipona bicolor]
MEKLVPQWRNSGASLQIVAKQRSFTQYRQQGLLTASPEPVPGASSPIALATTESEHATRIIGNGAAAARCEVWWKILERHKKKKRDYRGKNQQRDDGIKKRESAQGVECCEGYWKGVRNVETYCKPKNERVKCVLSVAMRKTENERNFKRRNPLNARNSCQKIGEKRVMGYKIKKENRKKRDKYKKT